MKQTLHDIIFSEGEYGLFVKKDEEAVKFYAGYIPGNDMVYLISESKSYNMDKLTDVLKYDAKDIHCANIPSIDNKLPFKEEHYYGLFFKDKYFSKFKFLIDKKEQRACCTLNLLRKNERRINNDFESFTNKGNDIEANV